MTTLALVVNDRLFRREGSYWVDSPNIADLVAAFPVERVVLCVTTQVIDGLPLPPHAQPLPSKLQVCELPPYRSNLDLLLRAPVVIPDGVQRLWRDSAGWDGIGAVMPTVFGLIALIIGLIRRLPVFQYIRGNVLASLRAELAGARHRHLILASIWPFHLASRLLALFGIPTLTMGQKLATRYAGPRSQALGGYARPAVIGDGAPPPNAADLRSLLYAGRLSGEKGVDILLEALALLRNEEWRLTVVGDGPERAHLEKQARDLDLADRIRFAGFVTEPMCLRAFLLGAGVVVVPSRTEGVPVGMVEAMALGRVLVGTAVGGIPDLLESEQAGWLVPPEDSAALAAALNFVWQHPSEAFARAQRGMEIARRRTIEAQAIAMLDAAGIRHG